jgi:hypothetical protein
MQLLAPDGYYVYLGIPKGTSEKAEVDADAIKKNYRKLSLKHHPDKRGGDAQTFRVLNRAQKVLANPKLRQQYDILGLDLDDDDEHQGSDDQQEGEDQPTTSQGIVHEIASMALTTILQMGVRTRTYTYRLLFAFYICIIYVLYIIYISCGYCNRIVGGYYFQWLTTCSLFCLLIHSNDGRCFVVGGAVSMDFVSSLGVFGLSCLSHSYRRCWCQHSGSHVSLFDWRRINRNVSIPRHWLALVLGWRSLGHRHVYLQFHVGHCEIYATVCGDRSL